MSENIAAELRAAVLMRARGRCEYCGLPDEASLFAHEVDHIIAEQHRGPTTLENLSLACFQCNRAKGPNIATIDPDSNAIVRLFNPRTDLWSDHFKLVGPEIIGQTSIGKATAALLQFNTPQRIQARNAVMQCGLWPT
jgi:hypothetical protein